MADNGTIVGVSTQPGSRKPKYHHSCPHPHHSECNTNWTSMWPAAPSASSEMAQHNHNPERSRPSGPRWRPIAPRHHMHQSPPPSQLDPPTVVETTGRCPEVRGGLGWTVCALPDGTVSELCHQDISISFPRFLPTARLPPRWSPRPILLFGYTALRLSTPDSNNPTTGLPNDAIPGKHDLRSLDIRP